MLLGALDHPKMYALAERLAVNRAQAIGHMELLWAFTSTKAPAGDLGKWPLTAVAQACDWMGDPATFMAALIAVRFVDEHPVHKYVVHDWHEHCPRFVKARVKALGTGFASMQSPTTVVDSRAPLQSGTTVSPAVGHSMPRHATPRHATHSDPPTAVRRSIGNAQEWTTNPSSASPDGSDPYPDETALMDAWAIAMSAYPERTGRTQWAVAEHHWRMRIDEGVTVQQLHAGVERYAAFVKGKGVSGPQYVLAPDKFFGDVDKPWAQPWVVPDPASSSSSSSEESRQSGNLAAAQEWLAKGKTQ